MEQLNLACLLRSSGKSLWLETRGGGQAGWCWWTVLEGLRGGGVVGVEPMRLDQQLAKPGPWWASVLQRCRQKAGQQLKVVAWLWEVDRGDAMTLFPVVPEGKQYL